MASPLLEIITSPDPKIRNQSLDALCAKSSSAELLAACAGLDAFRRRSDNLYERVRALFFLYAIHRFHLPGKLPAEANGMIPFKGFEHLLQRRFEEALEQFLIVQKTSGPSDAISSALAAVYQRIAFQTLADQVRRSVRSVRGNQWMFRMGHPEDHPLRLRPELLRRGEDGTYPLLRERTPVRMDLSHSGWSDIFFLGMDFPEGARVLNISIDLGVHGRDQATQPPVEACLRVIDEPVLRLTSVDLGASADISSLAEVFDFARDYLGLLKAAVIAAGIVPPGIEGSGQNLADLLARIVGPGRGLELVSHVNDIPKGSRLAVSTNLLASLISVCMRATSQAKSLTGELAEEERRLVLARALLGEWLGGSGGGWQDSGGVWPGMKLICGVTATEGEAEFGVSRGRLMPTHKILGREEVSAETRERLQQSLVLVHGGMAQNVGPILEMVTEKYLLRSAAEWTSRQQAIALLDEIVAALRAGDVRQLGELTTRNFREPIQAIIPWASNAFTESLIATVSGEFGKDFWGFWMLGGMSGGGMGFIFDPQRKTEAQKRLQEIMSQTKADLQHALPFAMEPVVYDFAINERGTWADLLSGGDALLPRGYYALHVPRRLRADPQSLTPAQRAELDKFGTACRTRPELSGMMQTLFDRLLPRLKSGSGKQQSLAELLEQNGFDRLQHEQVREDLKNGRIGLAQNRLPARADIKDVQDSDVVDATRPRAKKDYDAGLAALGRGELAVITLAAGVGSRWTQGAGVVKALHPFCKFHGVHRTFIETHLAKSRRIGGLAGCALPHIFTTSYLTHSATEGFLQRTDHYRYPGPLLLSPGRSIGLRMIPTVRDLRFLWEEMPQQRLDDQAQKVRGSLRAALQNWAHSTGEGGDYTDNLPAQCLHPVGHWFEVPNLLRNGVLARLLAERPQLKHLMLHNIDTLGADADPAMFGLHLAQDSCLTFEVITRRLEDRGGGLARVNGQLRLVEGLAMPREEEEFNLRFYNSNTCWINLDRLLDIFGLCRADLNDAERVAAAVRNVAARMPTYITIKDVKKRWGHGQEDVFPVSQFEKLWVDMTALPEVKTSFAVVPRLRGQQLKDQAQLDGWLRDGSADFVNQLCVW
jgi:galactokinase/mevalonate kinase-like predicted kinase